MAGFFNRRRGVISSLVLLHLSVACAMDISVEGPDTGTTGNFEKFACKVFGDDVNGNVEVTWKYLFKNGEMARVNDSDMLSSLETGVHTEQLFKTTSFIKLKSTDIQSIACQHSPELFRSHMINIRSMAVVTAEDDPCDKADKDGKPVAVLYTSTPDFVTPYRSSHYIVDGESIVMTYPTEVSQVKVVCINAGEDAPVWSMKKETASKMKFGAYAQDPNKKCKAQVLDIFRIMGQPDETVDVAVECKSGSTTVPINLRFKMDHSTRGRMDDKEPDKCVNEIVESFYNKELTGVGVASSFVIVLMMAGIAVMKKQLNQQKNINKELQGQNQGGNSTNNAAPGTSYGSTGTAGEPAIV